MQMALWEGTPHPPDPATLPEQGKAAPGAGARRGWFGGRKPSAGAAGAPDPGRELGTISADAGADPTSAEPAADALCPLGVAPLPSLVTVQGVLAAFKRLGVLETIAEDAMGRSAAGGGRRGPLGRRRVQKPKAASGGRAEPADAAEATHRSPFGRAEAGASPADRAAGPIRGGSEGDEGGLEPLAMDKSFSVAFASQLSAAGDAVVGAAPAGESAAERIARIVTPRASARAKAAKVRAARTQQHTQSSCARSYDQMPVSCSCALAQSSSARSETSCQSHAPALLPLKAAPPM